MSLLKRSGGTETEQDARRVKPIAINYQPLRITNFSDYETVHQTCVIISGECHSFDNSSEDFISVATTDCFEEKHPSQNWPVKNGQWKALVMLTPGTNVLEIALHHAGGVCESRILSLTSEPLLQLPPLLLAVLVAKDSPLLIDCPPVKQGAISTTHSDLNAAVAKFRMSAYMWQALTAEDFYSKGLGRRAFRLEEEWTSDSTNVNNMRSNATNTSKMGSVAKVHLVRTDKTVAELRQAKYAQQNPRASNANDLHKIFENALKAHGGPFEPSSRPVVAGLILDSTYSIEDDLILGHAALGCHNPRGLSLGIFGSHLTHSWPRFIEEVPACLLDERACGDSVGNDNGECETLRGACFVGQGAFLHEVGHAFGADHTTGIMARGYSKHWYKNFVGHIEYPNDATWDLEDTLKFMGLPHFKIPGDKPVSNEFMEHRIEVEIEDDADGEERLNIGCKAGLARIILSDEDGTVVREHNDIKTSPTTFSFPTADLDRTKDLQLKVLAMNGSTKTVSKVWKLACNKPYIKIAGTNFRLARKSVKSTDLESNDNDDNYWSWTTMLHEKGADGNLHRATAVDLRVGCTMDGAVVHYADGHSTNCGPVYRSNGQPHRFGGHASQKRDIPAGVQIKHVKLNRHSSGWGSLNGISIALSDGSSWGELNYYPSRGESGVDVLKAKAGHHIVGFFGRSCTGSGFTHEFGILTAPDGEDIPLAAYDMPELQNKDDSHGQSRDNDSDNGESEREDDDDDDDEEENQDDYDACSDHTE